VRTSSGSNLAFHVDFCSQIHRVRIFCGGRVRHRSRHADQVLGDGSPNPGPCSGPGVTFVQGRNRFRGPSYFNAAFAVVKNTKIPHWKNGVLSIGFQFFNLFNHANFEFPDNWSSDPTFGQILYQEQAPTSVLGSGLNANVSARMIQVKAQIQF
jgi:hypothetical protein